MAVSNFYAVVFDDIGWFVGRVETCVSECESIFKFMVRDGKKWRWPVKDDSTVHKNFVMCAIIVKPEGNGSRVRFVVPTDMTAKADELYAKFFSR